MSANCADIVPHHVGGFFDFILRILGIKRDNKMSDAELVEYIVKGPVASALGWSKADVEAELAKWKNLGEQLAVELKADHDRLTDAQRSRIYHYYLPTYLWCSKRLKAHREKYEAEGKVPPAFVVGISAPQGCGKTTIVEQLHKLFEAEGARAASVSIDDYYLTGADQDKLANNNKGNGLLKFRGNAGSHDINLAKSNLAELKGCTAAGKKVAVPRYDKSARSGYGDRAPKDTWPVVEGPVQVVLFEGWMLGFKPVGKAAAGAVDPQLVAVDKSLEQYASALENNVDAWVVVKVGDPEWVFKWRLQAEVQMRAAGKPGLTDEQVADFVARFMPAYKAYLPGLYKDGPTGRAGAPRLELDIDSGRTLVGAAAAPREA